MNILAIIGSVTASLILLLVAYGLITGQIVGLLSKAFG